MTGPIDIISVANEPIRAITKIPYKGFEINITMLTIVPEIVIYDSYGNLQNEFNPRCDGENLAEAFKFIDAKLV